MLPQAATVAIKQPFHLNNVIKNIPVKSLNEHSVHWGINPPQKHPLLSFLSSPPLNLQNIQASLFLAIPHSILFSSGSEP